jgi:WD40 repeat protein
MFHLGQVTCIQFSPQGDRIGTVANFEPSLCIWNSLTGGLLLKLNLNVTESNPRALVWLSDEQILAASETCTQCLDTSTGSTLATCPDGMTQLAISHGSTLAVGLNKRDVRFWDTDMLNWGPPTIKNDYEPCFIALFFYVLVAVGDGHSQVWNLTDPDLFVDPIQGLIDNAVSGLFATDSIPMN